MEDYEKFEQMINNSESMQNNSDPELDQMVQITQMLKHQQSEPHYTAAANSKRLMLAEAQQIRESSSQRRMSMIGSLYGWAVPAILLLAVVGVVFGNSSRDVVNDSETLNTGSAPGVLVTVAPEVGSENESSPEITATVTITPTSVFSITNGPVAVPVPEDLLPYPDPDAPAQEVDPVSVPDGQGGEIEIPVPQRPLPGSEIKPPEGESENELVIPNPGDGREGGRNPDS